MPRILALALALGLVGCASSPPPRTVVVQQVVYVDRTPPPVVQARHPLKRPRIGRFHPQRIEYAKVRRKHWHSHDGKRDSAKR
jgi:hypothetical protein